MCPLAQPGCWRACCQAGLGGGGAPDAGSGPSLREFPHGGADACTPRQGVTLLYGPSICTRSVQMDLRRSQVRRPFPTPGSGTLWVSGESLRDRRVSCLPRWTVCPTRSPSQDTNRSTCRGSALGRAQWPPPQAAATSGRWPTVPGVTHLNACAQMGPIRTPGGPPNPTGRVPHQRLSRALVTPAPPRTLRCWSLPPCFRPQGRPPVPRPLPCSLAPATSRLPPLSAPALACWCPLLFFFVFFLVCPPPPPMSPRYLLAVLALFVGGWRRWGRGGGGASSLSALLRKHVVSTAQARGAALSLRWGGGLAVWLPSSPYPSCGCTPGGPPVGACTARAPFGHGRVVRPALSFHCLPTLSRCPRGGGPLPAPVIPHVPSPSPRCSRPFPRWVWELGVGMGGRPRCPSSGVSTSQARRWHVARHLSFCWGVGYAAWPPSSPFPLCVRSPGAPPAGACTALASLGHGRVFRPAPSPRYLPILPLCPRVGGGRCPPLPSCIPHPWGGGGVWGGGGLVVFPLLLSCCRHEVRHPSLCTGGGGMPRGSRRRPFYPTLAPPVAPPPGLAQRVPSSGTAVWFVLHPPTAASPPCRVALGGGGSLFAPPYPHSPPSGGRGWVGGGGAPLSSPLRCTHVAGMT